MTDEQLVILRAAIINAVGRAWMDGRGSEEVYSDELVGALSDDTFRAMDELLNCIRILIEHRDVRLH